MSMGANRTEADIVGMFGDFGTGKEDVAKRSFNFIPRGYETHLAALDELVDALGWYANDLANFLNRLRENMPSVEGKSRQDVILALGENAGMRIYGKPPTWQEEEK